MEPFYGLIMLYKVLVRQVRLLGFRAFLQSLVFLTKAIENLIKILYNIFMFIP